MTDVTIEEIELSIEEARSKVRLAAALNRLADHPDFRLVISDGFFRDEAVRLVQAKASPALQSAEMQTKVIGQIDAIGNLYQYFVKVLQQGELAEAAIRDGEEAIEEMVTEGATL